MQAAEEADSVLGELWFNSIQPRWQGRQYSHVSTASAALCVAEYVFLQPFSAETICFGRGRNSERHPEPMSSRAVSRAFEMYMCSAVVHTPIIFT
jgi:hypothetical protein